jgi:hypothetical protein
MASLTTVYMISMILTSIAGIGSAFLGNKIYPLTGGAEPPPPTPSEVSKAAAEVAEKASKLASAEEFKIREAEKATLLQTPTEVPVSVNSL